jgi:hypothetical protein
VADVNGDGRLDVVTANPGSSDVSVLLGNGDGTFQTPQRFAVGGGPVSVAVADVNGDGRLDLVTANAYGTNGAGDVSVLLGAGDGTFQAEQRFGAGFNPSSVAVADVNGDGRLDLVTDDVSVLLQQSACAAVMACVQFPRLGNRHRYPVTISGVTDAQGNPLSLTITSIFQDEPVINPTGTTCPDGIGVGTAVAKIRNERLLAGDGRVYHIGFTATDREGASCTGKAKVCVPAKEGEDCGDQGALFDSTACP